MALSATCALLLLGIGALVMLGWVVQVPLWALVFPSGTSMVFNTALCFALCGVSLLMDASHRCRRKWISHVAGLAVIAVASASIAQVALQTDLGIDWPSLHRWFQDANPHAGRMAPNAALAFIAGGTAIALLHTPRGFLARRVLAAMVLTAGLLGLVGYTSLLDFAYTWFGFPRMAFSTSVGMLLLGAALLLERLGEPADATMSRRHGHLYLFFGAAMTILASIVAVTWGSIEGLRDRVEWVEHSHDVRIAIEDLALQYARAGLAWRDYRADGAPAHQEAFDTAAARTPLALQEVARLTAGRQTQRLDAIQPLIERDLATMRQSLVQRQAGPSLGAEGMPRAARAPPLNSSEVRQIIEAIRADETDALERRHRASHRAVDSTVLVILLGNLAGLAILLYTFVMLKRQSDRRKALEKAVQQSNVEHEDLYNNAPCGFHSVDENGVFVRMNDTELRWLGYARDEVIGKMRHHDIHTPRSRQKYIETFERFKRTGRLEDVEFEYLRKDGTTMHVSLSATTIVDAHGSYVMSRSALYDISERKKAEQDLYRANLFLDSIVENIPHMIFVKDAHDLRFVRLNKAGETLLGVPRQVLVGRTDADLFPKEQAQAFVADDRAVLSTGQPALIAQEPLRTAAGETRILRTVKISLPDPHGRPQYLLGISEDITERLRIEGELRTSISAADQANRAKSAFLAAMSHEIRTPMNGIIGMVDVLRQTGLGGEQRDMLETVGESASALLEIIESILDFSKIEAGKLELERIPVSVAGVLEGACESLAPLAAKKRVELLVFCDPRIPPRLYTDPVRLRQIVLNLVGNAIKFTSTSDAHRGRVVVRADVETTSSGRCDIGLSVVDNGIGMDGETAARIFTPFTQGEASTSRRYGGTGLGLSICKRILDVMGGRLSVDSRVGQGSTFRASVGFDIVARQENAERRFDLGDLDVLILSEQTEISEIVDRYLTFGGARAHRFDSVDEALGFAGRHSRYDGIVVVIVDGAAPALHAQVLRERFRLQRPASRIRFVFIARGRRRRAELEGADTVTLEADAMRRTALLRAVAVAAGRASPDVAATDAPPVLVRRELPSAAQAEQGGRLILVADDNETNRRVIGHQLALLGYAAELKSDGREALAAWRAKRYGLVLTDCHMPMMDGFQLTHAIRSDERASAGHVPIIAITANALKAEAQRCFAVGMDDCLTKPVKLDLLAATLAKWLPENAPSPQAAVLPAASAAQDRVPHAVDPDALANTLGIADRAVLDELYDDFVRTGAEAVRQLLDAHARRGVADVERLAHKLKSSARTVGANELAQRCVLLEQAAQAGRWDSVDELLRGLGEVFADVEQWVAQRLASV